MKITYRENGQVVIRQHRAGSGLTGVSIESVELFPEDATSETLTELEYCIFSRMYRAPIQVDKVCKCRCSCSNASPS